jgi:hypothetical protein
LAKKAEPFTLKEGTMHRCLTTSKAQIILKELNEIVVGGHFATNITAKKILDT